MTPPPVAVTLVTLSAHTDIPSNDGFRKRAVAVTRQKLWKCTEELENGSARVGDVLIERDGTDDSGKYRITDRSADALGDHVYGQWNGGHEWGSLRLLRCVQCHGLFVGHHAAGLCGDECRRLRLRASRPHVPSKMNRTERRRQAREGLTCMACGDPIEAQRVNRKCCSDRCRQRLRRQSIETGPLDIAIFP